MDSNSEQSQRQPEVPHELIDKWKDIAKRKYQSDWEIAHYNAYMVGRIDQYRESTRNTAEWTQTLKSALDHEVAESRKQFHEMSMMIAERDKRIKELEATRNAAGGKPDATVSKDEYKLMEADRDFLKAVVAQLKQKLSTLHEASQPAHPEPQEGGKSDEKEIDKMTAIVIDELGEVKDKKFGKTVNARLLMKVMFCMTRYASLQKAQLGKPEGEDICPECFRRQGTHHFSCSRDKKGQPEVD